MIKKEFFAKLSLSVWVTSIVVFLAIIFLYKPANGIYNNIASNTLISSILIGIISFITMVVLTVDYSLRSEKVDASSKKQKNNSRGIDLKYALIFVLIFFITIGYFGYKYQILVSEQKVISSQTPVTISTPTASILPKIQAKKTVSVKATVDPNPTIKCSISATCGGGFKEMYKSECDKLVCCQINGQWSLTSKDNCNNTQKQNLASECKKSWDEYRRSAMNICNSYLTEGMYDKYQSCMDSAGKTANEEIAKCSE